MLKLKNEKPDSIPVTAMKDGDVAVIVQWDCGPYAGRIVQRYKDSLICLGAISGAGWGTYFAFRSNVDNTNCRVRILESGETLVV